MNEEESPRKMASGQTSTQAMLCSDTKLEESVAVDELPFSDDQLLPKYITGWRLHIITIALCLAMFLPNFEVSIVSTSLLTITNELKGFNNSSWVVDAYLTTYTGLLIAWAKLSDIFGRKVCLMASLTTFMAFSGACGGAQTITQLIVFRAFQGIGGSGIYALGMVIIFEMVPATKYTMYAGLVTMIFAMALALGPISGGLITEHTTWRWVFLLNIPAAFVALFTLALTFPANFPDISSTRANFFSLLEVSPSKTLRRIDFLGTALLLGASIFLVTALQQVEVLGTWSSTLTISLLCLSGPFLLAFLFWERRMTRDKSMTEPVFPWRFVRSRVWMGMIMHTFFTGTVFTVCIIQIPLRLQAVNGFSTLASGTRLLPFGLMVPFGSFIAAGLSGKRNIPPVVIMITGTSIQVTALSLLSILPTTMHLWEASLGFEVMAGLGTGLCLGSLVMLTPAVCEKRDLAVATAAINQFRFLGGSVGLAVVSSAMYSWTRSRFLQIMDAAQFSILEQSTEAISHFSPELQEEIRVIMAQGYNIQMKILVGLAGMQFFATVIMWQRNPVRLES